MTEPPFPWEHDDYFKPVLEGDPLLQYDFEGETLTEVPTHNVGIVGDEERDNLLQRSVVGKLSAV